MSCGFAEPRITEGTSPSSSALFDYRGGRVLFPPVSLGCDLTPVLLALLPSRAPPPLPPTPSAPSHHDAPPPHPPPQPSPGSRDLLQGRLRPHSPLSLIPRLLQQKMRQNASVAPPLNLPLPLPSRPLPAPSINILLVTAKRQARIPNFMFQLFRVNGSVCEQAAVAGRSGDSLTIPPTFSF